VPWDGRHSISCPNNHNFPPSAARKLTAEQGRVLKGGAAKPRAQVYKRQRKQECRKSMPENIEAAYPSPAQICQQISWNEKRGPKNERNPVFNGLHNDYLLNINGFFGSDTVAVSLGPTPSLSISLAW
jgi:hypothetical protein